MIHRRRESDPAREPQPCAGELLFVTDVGSKALNLDCVLDFGAEGRLPVTLAVELPEDASMALFEEALLKRWLDDGRSVAATLTVSRERSRVSLSAESSNVVLPLRTATRSRPA